MRSVLQVLFLVFVLFLVGSCANTSAYTVKRGERCGGDGGTFTPGPGVISCQLFDINGVAVGEIEVGTDQALSGSEFCAPNTWFLGCTGARGPTMPADASPPICPFVEGRSGACYDRLLKVRQENATPRA